MPFGRRKTILVERLFVDEPDYIDWLATRSNLQGSNLVRHIGHMMAAIDQKPFQRSCQSEGCSAPATVASIYLNNPSLMGFHCDQCAAPRRNTVRVRSMQQLFDAVLRGGWPAPKTSLRRLVRMYATAKGLPERASEHALLAFVWGPTTPFSVTDHGGVGWARWEEDDD